MTTAHLKAGDVLRAIERYGPVLGDEIGWRFAITDATSGRFMRPLWRREMLVLIDPDQPDDPDEPYPPFLVGLSPAGRALLAARRARGRTT